MNGPNSLEDLAWESIYKRVASEKYDNIDEKSNIDKRFENWWARNSHIVRDKSEKIKTQHEKLKSIALMGYRGAFGLDIN